MHEKRKAWKIEISLTRNVLSVLQLRCDHERFKESQHVESLNTTSTDYVNLRIISRTIVRQRQYSDEEVNNKQ